MKNKLFSIGGLFLALAIGWASAPPIYAQEVYAQEGRQALQKEERSITGMRSNQLPAAYYQSSWTVVSERVDGVGPIAVSGVNPANFRIPNTAVLGTSNRAEQDQVFDNGPHFNVPGSPDLSVLESTALGMGTYGVNISYPSYAAADDFELTAETEITSIDLYTYQTGASGPSINEAYVQIWDGDPSGSGTVVWGDMSTNVFSSVESSGAYRVLETTQTDRSRMIQRVTVGISGLTLDAGTYYLEYSLGGTAASGPWQAPVAILGEDTTGDALQRTPEGWQVMLDSGTETPQGVPFQIFGNEGGSGGGGCEIDFAAVLEDGTGNIHTLLFADDFEVGADGMNVEKVTIRTFSNIGQVASLIFYEDDNGLPGAIAEQYSGITPASQTVFGTAFGFDAYDVEIELPSAAELEEGIYWLGVNTTVGTDGGTGYWIISEEGVLEPGQYSADGGATWTVNTSGYDFSFKLEGTCDGGGTGGGDYCIPAGTNSSYYIDGFSTTGGTTNISNLGSGFSPDGYGDFYDTHTVAQKQGEDVEFLADFSSGTYGFRVWVDWNQDGEFDASEEVAWNSSSYSNPQSGSFEVPADAALGETRMRIVGHWLSSSGDIDPCSTNHTYGEFEDYKFVVEEGGVTNDYCIPAGTNSSYYIDGFSTTGGTTNISNLGSGFSPDGYGDFYDTHTVAQKQGEDVEFLADFSSGTYGFRVWVDWNQDGEFDASEEVAWNSSSYSNPQSGSFEVPADAPLGETRMRIVGHWLSSSGDIDPCSTNHTYGEFEDYKFVVEEGGVTNDYCIPAGTNSSYYIDGFSTTGGTTNISNLGSGFSPDGYGDFYGTHTVAQKQGENVSFLAEFPSGQTYGFRVWVDWNQDGEFDASEEVAWNSSSYSNPQSGSFTVPADALEGETRMRVVGHWLSSTADIDPCATNHTYGEFEDYKFVVEEGGVTNDYCIPAGTNSSYYIDGFSTTGGTSNISNLGSGFSPDGYGDFYGTHTVAQKQGENVSFLAEFPSGQTYGFRVWVDWNQDGEFDASEEVAWNSSSYGNPQSGSFAVPADATLGETRMRVVGHWLNSSGDIDPCATDHTYGEYEDYKFVVEAGTGGGGCEIDFEANLDNGTGNIHTLLFADDFEIEEGTVMTIDKVTIRTFTNIGVATSLIFYENDNGLPGSIVEEFNNITPVSQTVFGNAFGFDAYDVELELPSSVELGEGIYWLGIQTTEGTDGGTGYWIISYEGVHQPGKYSSNGGATWTTNTNGYDYSFKLEGTCEGGGDPGLTYCEPFLDCTDGDVITNVTFQEIDNDSSCSPNGYGDYTSLVATVQSGDTYPISVTVGDGWAFESVSVWIDFDNSGTFDEDEFFYIGTGSDEPLVGDIDIPASLAEGQYRMRVRVAAVGSGTATWDMACDETQGYGETEDYTVEVDNTVGIDDQNQVSFTYYPNPTSGIVNIESNRDITNFGVYNVLGQEVLSGNRLDNNRVDLSSVATGTYVFRVTFEDGSVETFKVVRE